MLSSVSQLGTHLAPPPGLSTGIERAQGTCAALWYPPDVRTGSPQSPPGDRTWIFPLGEGLSPAAALLYLCMAHAALSAVLPVLLNSCPTKFWHVF